jgi:signal transduction histidine kinase
MNVLLYTLATLAAGALAVRVPLQDRHDPVRRAFSFFCSILAFTYAGWALYLLVGAGFFRYLNGAAAAFLPFSLFRFVDHLLRQPGEAEDARLRDVAVATPLVAVGYVLLDLLFHREVGHATVAEILLGAFIFGGLLFPLHRLFRRQARSPHRVERARMRYLLGLAGAAVGFSALEAFARYAGSAPDNNLTFLARSALLQGWVPPLGALFATVYLYFQAQMLAMSRLLDLNEIFARMATVAAAGAILVLLDVLSAGSLLKYPLHGLFQVFVASCLFLFAWDPLHKQLERVMGNLLNQRGQRLQETLAEVDAALGRVVSLDGFAPEVLTRLVDSGRVPAAGLYLWDPERRNYRLVADRGQRAQPPITQVGRQPFTDGFAGDTRAYIRGDLERLARRNTQAAETVRARLGMMDAMNADVVVPFLAGELVLGWLALRDEDWSDGFSEEEVARLAHTARRMVVTLENLQSFEKLKEESRLAALGTMAAGLAHEIRNPLAGIKGAAQYLQTGRQGEDAEMVEVIVGEVDRLNGVVSQFLDYARPLQLEATDVDLRALLGQTVQLLEARGRPITVDVPEDLGSIRADAPKLKQVLLNLGLNAQHAVRDGGDVTFRVRRGRLRDPKARGAPAIEIAVEDTGAGVSPEDLDKLFVPFFTTRHEGTGLGLAISQRIVQAHGGELDVRTAVGTGSTFTVRLPG